jgi:hypothetical protein
MYAKDVRTHLMLLAEERVLAFENGLGSDPAYMADLELEIATAREAYIGAAVTEIAVLQSELSGKNHG